MPALARWGHAAFAVGALATGAAPDLLVLALGRVLTGLGAGIGLLALLVVVFERTRPDLRPVVSAAVWSGIGLAIVLSGLVAPILLDEAGRWRWAFLVSGLLCAAVVYEVGRLPPPTGAVLPPVQEARPLRPRPVLAWIGLFGAYFMFGVGYIAYSTFVGGRLAAAQSPVGTVVLSWVSLGLGSIAGSTLGALLLWSPRWKPFTLVLALVAGSTGSAAALVPGPAGPLAGALLVGLGLASTPAIVTAFVRERSSDADYARVFSFATAALGIGQLVGPVIAGAMADGLGPEAVMIFAAIAYGAGAFLATWDLVSERRRYAGPAATGVSSREPHSAQDPS